MGSGGGLGNALGTITGLKYLGGDVGNFLNKGLSTITGASSVDSMYNTATAAPNLNAPTAPGAVPSPKNSAAILDDAAAAQRKAQGAKATIFGGANGGLLSSGSSSSQRLLLGA